MSLWILVHLYVYFYIDLYILLIISAKGSHNIAPNVEELQPSSAAAIKAPPRKRRKVVPRFKQSDEKAKIPDSSPSIEICYGEFVH